MWAPWSYVHDEFLSWRTLKYHSLTAISFLCFWLETSKIVSLWTLYSSLIISSDSSPSILLSSFQSSYITGSFIYFFHKTLLSWFVSVVYYHCPLLHLMYPRFSTVTYLYLSIPPPSETFNRRLTNLRESQYPLLLFLSSDVFKLLLYLTSLSSLALTYLNLLSRSNSPS